MLYKPCQKCVCYADVSSPLGKASAPLAQHEPSPPAPCAAASPLPSASALAPAVAESPHAPDDRARKPHRAPSQAVRQAVAASPTTWDQTLKDASELFDASASPLQPLGVPAALASQELPLSPISLGGIIGREAAVDGPDSVFCQNPLFGGSHEVFEGLSEGDDSGPLSSLTGRLNAGEAQTGTEPQKQRCSGDAFLGTENVA